MFRLVAVGWCLALAGCGGDGKDTDAMDGADADADTDSDSDTDSDTDSDADSDTDSDTDTDMTGDTGPCFGSLTGDAAVHPQIDCSVKGSCDGTLYVATYSMPPQPGSIPTALLSVPNTDLTSGTQPILLTDVPCGPMFAFTFLDVNVDAGNPPEPGSTDLVSTVLQMPMTEAGLDGPVTLDARMP